VAEKNNKMRKLAFILGIFIVGYLAVIFEFYIKVNRSEERRVGKEC
jgi:hypothetical protein